VEARAGFCTQLAGHRPGPIFVDVRASGIGTASLLTVSVLALLCRRAQTGAGGWAETSLYDGMLATLGCMIGRSERAAPEIEGYWEKGSTFPNFLYRRAHGELIQVWFGGKGMYGSLIEVLGDEPSADGYYSDQMTGKLGGRAARWVSFFATQPRDVWIQRLRAAGVACEPVLGPGEVLADPHLAETGLAVQRSDGTHRDVLVGSLIAVLARGGDPPDPPLQGDFIPPDPPPGGTIPPRPPWGGCAPRGRAALRDGAAGWVAGGGLLGVRGGAARRGDPRGPGRGRHQGRAAAFATAPAAQWASRLRDLGLLAELIEPLDRDGFRRAVLDDPVNRQLGRVVSYETADWGHFEQIGPLLRCGPAEPLAGGGPRLTLPGIGEHTLQVLTELGFSGGQIEALLTAKIARQLED